MTKPTIFRSPLLFGLATAAALLVAACGTGPIPGQTGAPSGGGSTSTTSSGGGGCTASSAKTSVTVDATNSLKFVPASVCLKVGGTITWKNVGNIFHTTTDDKSLAANPADSALPSGAATWNHLLNPGASYALKFTVAGSYKYFCIPHETLGMLGQITVVS